MKGVYDSLLGARAWLMYVLAAGLLVASIGQVHQRAGTSAQIGLALLYLVFVPYYAGAYGWLRIRRQLPSDWQLPAAVDAFCQWSLGFSLTVGGAYLAMWSGQLSARIYGITVLGLGTVAYAFGRWRVPIRSRLPFDMRSMISAGLLGLLLATYLRAYSPFPFAPGWDGFTHLYVVKQVVLDWRTSELQTLTYFGGFHILLALASATFSVQPLDLLWAGIFLSIPVFAIGLYAFLARRSGPGVAFLGTVIGVIAFTEQGFVPNLPVFYPPSVAMVLFPWILVAFDSQPEVQRRTLGGHLVVFLVILVGYILLHVPSALVMAGISALFLSVHYLSRRILLGIRIVTLALTFLALLYFLRVISFRVALPSPWGAEYLLTTATKVKLLGDWYTDVLFEAALLGFLVLAVSRRAQVVPALVGCLMVVVYFQEIGFIHRIASFVRPILSLSAATTLWTPVLLVQRMLRGTRLWHRGEQWVPRLYGLVVLALLFPVMTGPYQALLDEYTRRGFAFVNFTSDELRTSRWIFDNTRPDAVLVSDPGSVLVMRGLSYRRELDGVGQNRTVSDLLHAAFSSNSSGEAAGVMRQLAGEDAIVLVTPRTGFWLDNWPKEHYVSWPLSSLNASGFVDKFLDGGDFRLVFRSGDVYVFFLS